MIRALAIALGSLSACASLHQDPSKTEDVVADADADFKAAAFTQASGTAATPGGKVEWMTCKGQHSLATVLVMHSDAAGFAAERFCKGWYAQAFLTQEYDVVAVNRPGYGTSTGTADYTGAASLAALDVALPLAVSGGKLPKPVVGVWGYGSGATAAAIAAKHLHGLKFLVVGGGIYDLDETLRSTTDARTKADIATIKRTGGSKAVEDRSIGYDPSGLPPTVVVYHGDSDTVAPTAQAKALADSLTSSGQYKVTYQALEHTGHDIPWVYHRHILEALVKGLGSTHH